MVGVPSRDHLRLRERALRRLDGGGRRTLGALLCDEGRVGLRLGLVIDPLGRRHLLGQRVLRGLHSGALLCLGAGQGHAVRCEPRLGCVDRLLCRSLRLRHRGLIRLHRRLVLGKRRLVGAEGTLRFRHRLTIGLALRGVGVGAAVRGLRVLSRGQRLLVGGDGLLVSGDRRLRGPDRGLGIGGVGRTDTLRVGDRLLRGADLCLGGGNRRGRRLLRLGDRQLGPRHRLLVVCNDVVQVRLRRDHHCLRLGNGRRPRSLCAGDGSLGRGQRLLIVLHDIGKVRLRRVELILRCRRGSRISGESVRSFRHLVWVSFACAAPSEAWAWRAGPSAEWGPRWPARCRERPPDPP